MGKYRIWISPPHLGGNEKEYVKDAFDKNWITTIGDNVSGFEEDVRQYLGENSYAVALNSGTAALHLALILLNVQKDDYVLCQDLTFAATINPVVYLGANPILIDSERETWNLSPVFLEEAVQACLKKGKKPKAIVWVNLYGMPAHIKEIREIGKRYEIPLLEDSAESFGSRYYGQKCGTFGDVAVLSFNGNKIITTSGGGMLLSSEKTLIEKARFLASQAKDPAPYYLHSHIGYNYAMSNIVAGIGRGQMEVLEKRIAARRANHLFYKQALAGLPGFQVHSEPNENYFSNHWLTCLLIDPKQTGGIDRETIRLKLANKGIESRPLWNPMHLQPVFKPYDFYGDGTSEDLFRQGLCLPSGSNLSETDLNEIVSLLKDRPMKEN
jgi:dTDP-4-amino-4,6-dideoxygalactose transaminase